MNVGAGHGALASVGEHELATVGQRCGNFGAIEIIVASVGVGPGREDFGRDMVGAGGKMVVVVLIRREIGRIDFGGTFDGTGRRKRVVAIGCYLCGSHEQC